MALACTFMNRAASTSGRVSFSCTPGQLQGKHRATFRSVRCRECPAHLFGGAPRDRKSQAEVAVLSFIKTFKEMRQVFLTDPWTIVGNADSDHFARILYGDPDLFIKKNL